MEGEGLHFPLAGDGELDLGVGLAAHALDGVVEGHVGDGFAVDLRDDVPCAHARAGGRRVVDRRNHAHAGGILRHLEAEASEGALGALVHVLEAFHVEEVRVRVETAHHPLHGKLQELVVGDVFDVVVLDGVENARELTDFLQRKVQNLVLGTGLQAHGAEGAGDGADADES